MSREAAALRPRCGGPKGRKGELHEPENLFMKKVRCIGQRVQFTPPGSHSLTHLPSMGRLFSAKQQGTAIEGRLRLSKNLPSMGSQISAKQQGTVIEGRLRLSNISQIYHGLAGVFSASFQIARL